MIKPRLRRVITTATYKAKASDMFLAAIDPGEMVEAMSGIAEVKGMPEKPLKQGEIYRTDVTTFKIFKTRGYEMFIEHLDKDACVLQSREKGGAIKLWYHRLSIQQDGETAIWTDDVTIDAGLMTTVFARYCADMYRYRHKHRNALSITTRMEIVKRTIAE